MHILLIITRTDQKSIAIRLDSSSSNSVTFVSITRYTLWHIFSTLGLCVVTIQVLFGFCSIMLRSTFRSVVTSSADVASSNRRIGALRRTARAIEIRCACHSERPRPRSPSALLIVSGSFSTNSHAQAIFKASIISSSVASSLTIRIFSAIVPERIVFP